MIRRLSESEHCDDKGPPYERLPSGRLMDGSRRRAGTAGGSSRSSGAAWAAMARVVKKGGNLLIFC